SISRSELSRAQLFDPSRAGSGSFAQTLLSARIEFSFFDCAAAFPARAVAPILMFGKAIIAACRFRRSANPCERPGGTAGASSRFARSDLDQRSLWKNPIAVAIFPTDARAGPRGAEYHLAAPRQYLLGS